MFLKSLLTLGYNEIPAGKQPKGNTMEYIVGLLCVV